MTNLKTSDFSMKNADSPFTELFSIMSKYFISDEFLAGATQEIEAMRQHIDNSVQSMLQGLQNIGHLMGVSLQNKDKLSDEIKNIGFFIASIGNLVEALNALRSDADFVLQQRGVD